MALFNIWQHEIYKYVLLVSLVRFFHTKCRRFSLNKRQLIPRTTRPRQLALQKLSPHLEDKSPKILRQLATHSEDKSSEILRQLAPHLEDNSPKNLRQLVPR